LIYAFKSFKRAREFGKKCADTFVIRRRSDGGFWEVCLTGEEELEAREAYDEFEIAKVRAIALDINGQENASYESDLGYWDDEDGDTIAYDAKEGYEAFTNEILEELDDERENWGNSSETGWYYED